MSKLIHTDFGRNVKLLKKGLNRRIKFPTEGLHTHCVFMGMLRHTCSYCQHKIWSDCGDSYIIHIMKSLR